MAVGWVFYGRVLHDDMKVIVLKRILKRIGVAKKNEERYEKEIEAIFLGKDGHPLYIKKGRENPSPV
jgi:hypothetical protein